MVVEYRKHLVGCTQTVQIGADILIEANHSAERIARVQPAEQFRVPRRADFDFEIVVRLGEDVEIGRMIDQAQRKACFSDELANVDDGLGGECQVDWRTTGKHVRAVEYKVATDSRNWRCILTIPLVSAFHPVDEHRLTVHIPFRYTGRV